MHIFSLKLEIKLFFGVIVVPVGQLGKEIELLSCSSRFLQKCPGLIADSDFFSFHTIQMQKMSYFRVEPRRKVTIHPQSRYSKSLFSPQTDDEWFSFMAGSTHIVDHQRARTFPLLY